MSKYFRIHVITVAISSLTAPAFAQKTVRGAADDDCASLIRATRIIRKVDKDGNGAFEKSEDAAAWKRYRKLDANKNP